MALIGGYEDSGGGETYARRRQTVTSASSPAPDPGPAAPTTIPEVPAPQTPAPQTPPPEAPAPRTANYGWLSGYDTSKLNDPNHLSAKYQIGRTFGYYNPQQGITDDLLKELNALGLANFSGSGQHLSLSGITDKGRQAGLDPYDFSGDFIQGFANGTNPNAKWQYDAWQDPNQQMAQNAAQMPSTLPFPQSNPFGLPPGVWTFGGQQQAPDMSWLGPVLQTILQPPQQPQAPVVPPSPAAPVYGPPPSAPVTQATPMPISAPAGGGSGPVQTITGSGPVTLQGPGMDPFIAWLRQQLGGMRA